MIHSSGIGVVLRELLCAWARRGAPPLYLLGDPARIGRSLPPGLAAEIIPWPARIYDPVALLTRPRLPRGVSAWFSPHYATCMRPRMPMVCMIHDVLHITHPTRWGTAAFMRGALALMRRNAEFVLAPSRHVKVQLQTLHGFRGDRVLLAPNGPGPLEGVAADPANLPAVLRGREYLLTTAIFKPHKNWDFLLEQLATRRDLEAMPLVCLGLGRDGAALRRLAQHHGMDRRILMIPYQEPAALAAIQAGARVCIHAAVAEGFGLPLLEAMRFGTPIVHADRAPMKEIAAGTGHPFDPAWPASFHAALDAALAEPADAPARAARRVASSTYSWDATADVVEYAITRAITCRINPCPGHPC